MNIRWNVILGVIALCALAWFYSLNQETADLSELVKKPDSPDYVGYKMETTVFFPDGKNNIWLYPIKLSIIQSMNKPFYRAFSLFISHNIK